MSHKKRGNKLDIELEKALGEMLVNDETISRPRVQKRLGYTGTLHLLVSEQNLYSTTGNYSKRNVVKEKKRKEL